MNPLILQKQLLIAESELNREQLVQEWRTLADEARSLASRAVTLNSLASTIALLVAGLSSFRCQTSAPAAEKPSWLQTLLKGAGLISTLWRAFRPSDECEKPDGSRRS
jgi:hypothetical protein